jgi:hypothetical protein
MTVLEANLFRRESYATGDDEPGPPLSEQSEPGDRMRSRVVRVDNVGAPLTCHGAELARGPDIPFTPQRQPISGEARALRAANEGRSGGSDHERAISQIAKARGQKKYLALAATPTASGIDMKDTG